MASRRGAEEIILGGRVSINGHVITELATQVQPEDKVVVDGSTVRAELPITIVLNKPKGYLCSRGDTHERMTIYDLLPLKFQNLHHVGRLDKDSEGLILLTNRGDLSHRIIHPSQGAEKEYEVVVDQAMTIDTMGKLAKGMLTEEGYARAERAWLDGAYKAHVVLKQGLKRQIRLMFYHLGYEVVRLTRIRIGWLQLRGLAKGAYKELTPTEVERFFKVEAQKGREPPPKMPKSATQRPNRYAPSAARAESQDESWGDEDETPRSQASEREPGRRARKTAAAKRAGSPPARFSSSETERSEKKPRGRKPAGSGSSFGKPASKRAFKRPRSGETERGERAPGRSGSKPARRPAPPEGRRGPPRPRSR